jgi:competence protein ComFA
VKKVIYEIDGRRYTTHDLTFDLAYWHAKGITRLFQLIPMPEENKPTLQWKFWKEGSPGFIREEIFLYSNENLKERVAQAYLRTCEVPKGRALLGHELDTILPSGWRDAMQVLILEGKAQVLPGVDEKKRRCNRCGSKQLQIRPCASCNHSCAYCEACLSMGRAKICTPLFYTSPGNNLMVSSPLQSGFLHWQGELTPPQQAAAEQAATLVKGQNQQLLVWAVCGAGKTEVSFIPISCALRLGQQVMVVTPRKDVVLELYPRFLKAFPHAKVIALHGSSTEKWQEADITLSTTHQALRFYEKFDFIVIDEVDAFPFHNNPMLAYAVERARKKTGNFLYLSATPPDHLKHIPHVRIPARFHRRPLAIPQLILDSHLQKRLQKNQLHPTICPFLTDLLQQDRQAFFFVPYIEAVSRFTKLLQQVISFAEVEGTHSRDPLRDEKVQHFREGKIRVLVTTTIMERGVTVPKTDVVVYFADAPIFDESSLVQISGRTGRSREDPIGQVLFVAEEKTKEIVKAIRHIQGMNKLAKKRGYLD